MNIGIFGAQGNFGGSLYNRLQKIKPSSVTLIPTKDKVHNKEIATVCDLAIIAVQPQKVDDLIAEIKDSLQLHTQILSFAAHCSLEAISVPNHAAARGMADPWWNVSAFLLNEEFSRSGIEWLFENLTAKKPLFVKDDQHIEAFTVSFCYLFAVLLLQALGRLQDTKKHLDYIASRLECSTSELELLAPAGDPQTMLDLIATKGGVTEKIVHLLESDKNIKPEEVFNALI